MFEISTTWVLIGGAVITLVLAAGGFAFGFYVIGPWLGRRAIKHTRPQISIKKKCPL
jgi:hypothetical protein